MAAATTEPAATGASPVLPQLVEARQKLEAKDLPGALALYEEVLVLAGDRADVLVTISGDLGVNGHVKEIIELVAPRYDAERHGPATGLNVLQAYLALRNAEAAQHVLDILFSLKRPELEERLFGFSNAIAELIQLDAPPLDAAGAPADAPVSINLVSISKPIWFYGLEPLAAQILPPKEGKLRRVAFTQLALPGRHRLRGAGPKTRGRPWPPEPGAAAVAGGDILFFPALPADRGGGHLQSEALRIVRPGMDNGQSHAAREHDRRRARLHFHRRAARRQRASTSCCCGSGR